ncbi:MAG TPA: class I SAM-dependent methyltransferase [Acidimicrobiales bacterium]|nr:class I SAM-dependent methyltransferase [Acidimicrobiales bacterium]
MSDDAETTRRARRDLVRRGYDQISEKYRSDDSAAGRETESTAEYAQWLGELAVHLPAGGSVLDLGCGAGVPGSRLLAEWGFEVTGVDISAVQIRRARNLVPAARFVQADVVEWECDPGTFDAIVSLYTLIHIPLEDQQSLLPKLANWLKPGGYLLVIIGHTAWTGTEDYLGAEMFWDHADAETTLGWITDMGFMPVWQRFIPEGSSGHTLVLAQR